MPLKTIILLFFCCAGTLLSEDPLAYHNTNPASSASYFWLSPQSIKVLQKAAFSGDIKSANRLGEFYCFCDYQPDVFFAWLYIQGLLSEDDNGWYALDSHFEAGALKSTDGFLTWKARLGELHGKEDTFSRFVLYRYYLATGDAPKAANYRSLIEKAGVSPRLLRVVKFNDYPDDVSGDFNMRYRFASAKELALFIDPAPETRTENIKNPFYPFGGLYLVGFLEGKHKSEITTGRNPEQYLQFPIEVVFYKTDNPYYRKKVNFRSGYHLGYFLIPLGSGNPEQYATLKYAILPRPPTP